MGQLFRIGWVSSWRIGYRLQGLEFFRGSNPILEGQTLIGRPYDEVVSFIKKIDASITEDGSYGFHATRLGIKSFNSDTGRELKVVFFIDVDESVPVVITAYEPNDDEVKLYEKIQRQKKK